MISLTEEERDAINRLVVIACGAPTGQARKAASLLLAWWNAEENGTFDFRDAWSVDSGISRDMIVAAAAIMRVHEYPLAFGYDFENIALRYRKAS